MTTSTDLAALANRARAEGACPNSPVTARDIGKVWEAITIVTAHAAMLAARVEELEARPRAGRPPKAKVVSDA